MDGPVNFSVFSSQVLDLDQLDLLNNYIDKIVSTYEVDTYHPIPCLDSHSYIETCCIPSPHYKVWFYDSLA